MAGYYMDLLPIRMWQYSAVKRLIKGFAKASNKPNSTMNNSEESRYVLDLHDAGHWLIRDKKNNTTQSAGNDKHHAIDLIKRLNNGTSLMDEIENFLRKNRINKINFAAPNVPVKDNRRYEFTPKELKHLIELVEEEQVENCAERVNRDMKEFVRESERVSQQLIEKTGTNAEY